MMPWGASSRRGIVRAFIQEEEGQAVTEYVLLLLASLAAVTAMARAILGVLDKGILTLGGQLEKDLKTGRAPVDVYKN